MRNLGNRVSTSIMKILRIQGSKWTLFLLVTSIVTHGCADRAQKTTPPAIAKRALEIDSIRELTTPWPKGIERLVLRKGARLITHGKDLSIEVDEIESDEGVIESFPEGHHASAGMDGKGGGQIEIKAKSAKGTLYVFGRGEDGGNGIAGEAGKAGVKGKGGQRALGTHLKGFELCHCGKVVSALKQQFEDGTTAEQIQAMRKYQELRSLHRCIYEGSNGAPGARGEDGQAGGNGGSGGASSQILIHVGDAADFLVKAYPIAGRGGSGGGGAAGGGGGAGGDPGDHKFDDFRVCPDLAAGPPGVSGGSGMPGLVGQSGTVFPMCIRLGDTNFGDCENFQ